MKKIILLSVWAVFFGVGLLFGQSHTTIFDRANFIVENLDSINTIASDISPSRVGDQLYYSSVRKAWWEKPGRLRKNTAFYNQYMAPLGVDGKTLGGIARVQVPGLGLDFHQGPVAYCEKTQELFVTESNTSDPDSVRRMIPKSNIRLKLVVMRYRSGKWEKTEEMPFNDKRYNFAHPAISVTGDTLVFSSDRPGGIGQTDLYMSIRQSGQWGEPLNLGGIINNLGTQMFPTFLPGGLLSFASDGHSGSYGFLDIWYTQFPAIGEVKNAGDGINTQFDDFGLIIDNNLSVGYFSSNRPGKGSDDVFQVDIIARKRMLTGIVYDAKTSKPLPGALVRLLDCNGNEKLALIADSNGAFKTEIPFSKCLVVEGSMEGYKKTSENVGDLDYVELFMHRSDSYQLLVVDASDKKPLELVVVECNGLGLGQTNAQGKLSIDAIQSSGCTIMLNAEGYLRQTHRYTFREKQGNRTDTVMMYNKEIGQKFVLKNINYDFDKWDILPESEIELNKLVQIMKDNPGLKVELGSHTDARGTDGYNRILSQKRSESAVAYILKSGIDKRRINAKGYGESQLINACKNQTECPDWEHRQNRRTEFKITGL